MGGWLALQCFAYGLALMLVGRRGNWTMPIKKGRKGERRLDYVHQKGEKGLWVMEAGDVGGWLGLLGKGQCVM